MTSVFLGLADGPDNVATEGIFMFCRDYRRTLPAVHMGKKGLSEYQNKISKQEPLKAVSLVGSKNIHAKPNISSALKVP